VRLAKEKDFIKGLATQDGSKITVPDYYTGFKFPLHVLSWQAYDEERPWSDVDLILKNLPARMAKDALMRQDDEYKMIPLHAAARNAPRSVIDRMLALAPDAARVKDSRGSLPLHKAAYYNYDNAVESLVNAYPDALFETNNYGYTPMDEAISNGRKFLKNVLLAAMDEESKAKYQNYGELLEDKSLYNGSINPVNIILLECIHDKRSPEDVVEFIKQLQRTPAVLRFFVYHTMKSDTESSPNTNVRKIKFKDEKDRAFDIEEVLASHNAFG